MAAHLAIRSQKMRPRRVGCHACKKRASINSMIRIPDPRGDYYACATHASEPYKGRIFRKDEE